MNDLTFEHIKDKKVKRAVLAWIELKLSKRSYKNTEKIRYNTLPKHKRKKWDDLLMKANIRLYNARSAYDSAMSHMSQIQIKQASEEATSVKTF